MARIFLLNEVHDEIYTELFNEDEVHADDEWVVHLVKNELFKVQVLQ